MIKRGLRNREKLSDNEEIASQLESVNETLKKLFEIRNSNSKKKQNHYEKLINCVTTVELTRGEIQSYMDRVLRQFTINLDDKEVFFLFFLFTTQDPNLF